MTESYFLLPVFLGTPNSVTHFLLEDVWGLSPFLRRVKISSALVVGAGKHGYDRD